MKKKNPKEIVVGVCGGISAYKACELVRLLKKRGHMVTVLMTEEARNFVAPLTFRTLSGRPVVSDMFSENVVWDPVHISIADRADLVVIVPATAHIIAKSAQGLCDDIISCVLMATKAKVLFCPAMNDNMYAHPSLQNNLKTLKKYGYDICGPVKGDLACGRTGPGHLAGVDEIARRIEKLVK